MAESLRADRVPKTSEKKRPGSAPSLALPGHTPRGLREVQNCGNIAITKRDHARCFLSCLSCLSCAAVSVSFFPTDDWLAGLLRDRSSFTRSWFWTSRTPETLH